ncbi:hypothetical protein CDAR_418731 [Caerostris darwini]|uniref:Uncharacterized protein n=1 Tax=Caerostris darwini TaxID=1538125 RepID=A0AAV4MV23_9ARAC|nr:hypothetical protein CDAR_418731 [Caerostris darwini]
MPPLKKNASFRLRGKGEIVKFGDSSTFYDTLFRNSLPVTERNDPLCRKFLLLDQISREIGKKKLLIIAGLSLRGYHATFEEECLLSHPKEARDRKVWDSRTFYDTLFRNSLPATERNSPLCRKFLLLDQISREISKSHS